MSDNETFKICLFLDGNDCAVDVAKKWILSSTNWTTPQIRKKRLNQLVYLLQEFQQDSKLN